MILGYDAAGVVEVVGSQVTRWKPGDEVFYSVSRSIEAVRAYGKLATVVSLEGSLQGMQAKNLTLYFGFMERTEAKIQALETLIDRGQLRPLIDSTFPLEQIGDAHRKLEAGGIKAKVVIQI
ncbi:MAG: hypothetical protein RL685_4756 [Pseudomonadota bacterium]|jgi:NADPH2:quinone reductase